MGKAKAKTPMKDTPAEQQEQQAAAHDQQEMASARATSAAYCSKGEDIKRAVDAKFKLPTSFWGKLMHRLNLLSVQYHTLIGNTLLYQVEIIMWNAFMLFLVGLVLFGAYKQTSKLIALISRVLQ